MTREEQIRDAIDTIIPIFRSNNGRTYEQALMASGFEAGVNWADNNPKSPWISVENDLPCKHPQLLEKVNYTQTVLVVLSWNDDPTKRHIETAYMCNNIGSFDVNWYWENRAHYHVTHWMPLPELPKE